MMILPVRDMGVESSSVSLVMEFHALMPSFHFENMNLKCQFSKISGV